LLKWAKTYWLAFTLTALGLMVGAAGFVVGRSSVKFGGNLNTLAEQLARTTGSSRPLDVGLDHRIDGIAKTIRSELQAAVQPVRLRTGEEPAGAACPLTAKPSVINLSPHTQPRAAMVTIRGWSAQRRDGDQDTRWVSR